MKRLLSFLGIIIVFAIVIAACTKDQNSINPKSNDLTLKANDGCLTIQSGELLTSSGEVITTGYMENGYNYQAHIYNGEYAPGWHLVMKWNDAWLSNKSCDGDVYLDRPVDENGDQYYFGSGAWCTNHWTTTYTLDDGTVCIYDEFTKIIAVPEESYTDFPEYTDPWGETHLTYYTAEGDVIGYEIWGQFAIIESIINDPCAGVTGVEYKSPDHAGFGGW
jgi:hypothetical protein